MILSHTEVLIFLNPHCHCQGVQFQAEQLDLDTKIRDTLYEQRNQRIFMQWICCNTTRKVVYLTYVWIHIMIALFSSGRSEWVLNIVRGGSNVCLIRVERPLKTRSHIRRVCWGPGPKSGHVLLSSADPCNMHLLPNDVRILYDVVHPDKPY